MRVRVAYTVEVDEGTRRAIRHAQFVGDVDRPATREEVSSWYQTWGEAYEDDLRMEHGVCCWGDAPQGREE